MGTKLVRCCASRNLLFTLRTAFSARPPLFNVHDDPIATPPNPATMRVTEIIVDVRLLLDSRHLVLWLIFCRASSRTPSGRLSQDGRHRPPNSSPREIHGRHANQGRDESFNSITGLNGSGKSNILDSICFVLGITSMATVRAQNIQVRLNQWPPRAPRAPRPPFPADSNCDVRI